MWPDRVKGLLEGLLERLRERPLERLDERRAHGSALWYDSVLEVYL